MLAWQNLLLSLERKLGSQVVKKWLYSLKIVKFDACNLYLEAKNSFQAIWFEEHVRSLIKKNFYNENHHLIKVHISIANTRKISKDATINSSFQFNPDILDPYFTFPSFIVSDKNKITFEILSQATESQFNPIYVYGLSGTGKTHLLIALANQLKKTKKVFYVKASSFTQHVIAAIRLGAMHEFRKTYRMVDVLIVDDIHILSNKVATQEEFFHTFNTLHTNGCNIILSSNTSPRHLVNIEERLISRFEWGITLSLEKLEKEHLKDLIINKANLMNLSLSQDVINYLLDHFKNTVSIKKALQTLTLKSHLNNNDILDIKTTKSYLSILVEEEQKTFITHDKIITLIADHFGIRANDILGKSQTRECALPRQFCMYFIRELLKIPYMKIGLIFKRDHSTVMTSIKFIKKQLDSKNQETYFSFLDISKKLQKFT